MKPLLRALIRDALGRAVRAGELADGPPVDPPIEVPREAGHGDLSSSVAMLMARAVRKPPRQVAEILVKHLEDPEGLLQQVEIAGPGFVNFTLSPAAWRRRLGEILAAGDAYGSSHLGAGRRVQVEFVSANPTGPLHVGHGRGAATGDALARILEAAGFVVEREYYVNDAGGQMATLGRSVYARYLQACGRDAPFPEEGYPGDYVVELGESLKREAGDRWAHADPEAAASWMAVWAGERMLDRIRSDLAAFSIRFDHFTSERGLREDGTVAATIDELRRRGHLYEQDGAWWFRATAFGDEKDRTVIKSDGELTYFASDIAYHRAKLAKGYYLAIDVWGADHHGYVKRVEAALRACGADPLRLKVVLVQIVNLTRDGQPIRMGKRMGTFIPLAEVVDEVGPDLARFFFLMRRSDAQLEFDLELARRQTAENPVFYIQYAHTRIAGIFRQAAERGLQTPSATSDALAALSNADELGLIKLLDEYPEVVEGAAESLEPHRVVFYAQRVAGEFHRFYARNRCVSDDDAVTAARLLLVTAVKQVVGHALRMVGVGAPERM
jgi:arginyl-tRNA synthetase